VNVAAGAATPTRRPWPRVDFWGAVTVGALGVFVLLLVYPLLRLFAASLSGEDGAVATVLHTYGEFFTRRYYYETLVNSLVVSALATVLATLLGAPLAWFVNRFDIPGKLLVRALIVLTFVSPPFIGAYAWILLLGRNGVITGWLAQLGLALPPIYGVNGVVLVFTLQALPFVFLMVSAGLKTVDWAAIRNSMLSRSGQEPSTSPTAARVMATSSATFEPMTMVRLENRSAIHPAGAASRMKGRVKRMAIQPWREDRAAVMASRLRPCLRKLSLKTPRE